MMHFLLACFVVFALAVTIVCYCAMVTSSRYSRMEEADELEQMQQGGYDL